MSFLSYIRDQITADVNSVKQSELPFAVGGLLGAAAVHQVLDKLNESGYGAKVNSWLGNGTNQPLTPDELVSALGDKRIQQIARSVGVPADKLASYLAQHLPSTVDQMSPHGKLEP